MIPSGSGPASHMHNTYLIFLLSLLNPPFDTNPRCISSWQILDRKIFLYLFIYWYGFFLCSSFLAPEIAFVAYFRSIWILFLATYMIGTFSTSIQQWSECSCDGHWPRKHCILMQNIILLALVICLFVFILCLWHTITISVPGFKNIVSQYC